MRKSFGVGIITGLVLTILALYPVVGVLLPELFDDWQRPISNNLVHMAFLGSIAVSASGVLLTSGGLAAWRAGSKSMVQGAKAGLVSGVVAGALFFLLIVSPLNGLYGAKLLLFHQPSGLFPFPPSSLIQPFVERVSEDSLVFLELSVLIGGLVGAGSGAVGGFLSARLQPRQQLPLFQAIHGRNAVRAWFGNNDGAFQTGAVAGLAYGTLISIASAYIFWDRILADYQGDRVFITPSMATALGKQLSTGLFDHITPLFGLGMVLVGGLAVVFLRNPTNRFVTRVYTVFVAQLVSGVMWLLTASRHLNFWVGLSSFAFYLDNESIENGMALHRLFRTAPALAFFALLLPLGMLILVVLAQLGLGVTTGSLIAWLVPRFVKRPVDHAYAIQKRLKAEPNMLLPAIYQHFTNHSNADETLVHLALAARVKQPELARLVSAYHTLCTDEANMPEAIGLVREVLQRWPQWRWSFEVGELYQRLDTLVAAQTLDQILELTPDLTAQSGTLPPQLRKGNDQISEILTELHKVAKVDDLSSKVIFLNTALERMREAQHYVSSRKHTQKMAATPFPEHRPLAVALDHGLGVVLEEMRRLRGRALVQAELVGDRYTYASEIPLTIRFTNEGLNVAQNLRLQLTPSEEWELVGDDPLPIAILPPTESREVRFKIAPGSAGRLRVEWQVTYDDAIDEDRVLPFAGVIEFVQEGKPFQRIFPNPYVTGTPLKTGDLFVGRDDVFRYVKDNLVGAYQNNVIVLHGQRRTGKTSVLYRLKEVMVDTHLPVLVDMQGKPARGAADFLYSIADDIAYELEDLEIEVELPEREEFEKAPEFTFRNRFLRETCELLDGRNLLLMFDEFEELQRRVEAGRLSPDIFPFLRNLMQHEERVDFLFTGTHKLEELAAEYWSILFNIAAYKRVTFLQADDVRRLITQPVEPFGMEYDPLAIESILRATAGHPYFTQVVLHEMVDHHNEEEAGYHTNTCVNQVLESITERGEAHFKFIWAESTDPGRLALQAMTELLAAGADGCTIEDVGNLLSTRGHKVEATELKAALDQLESRDIVGRSGPRSPLYRFQVDLIRLWIDRTRPGL